MSVHLKTRVGNPARRIRAVVAVFVLASGVCLLAQEQKNKDKTQPPPAHNNTPPPRTPPRTEDRPAVHTANPPVSTPQVHQPSGGSPVKTGGSPQVSSPQVHQPTGNPQVGNPQMHQPSNPQMGNPQVHQPAGNPQMGNPQVHQPAGNPQMGNPQMGNPQMHQPAGNPPGMRTDAPHVTAPNNDRPRTDFSRPPSGNLPNRGFSGTPNRGAPSGGPRPVYHGANGSEVHYTPNGQPQMVRAHGMTITHGPAGVRQVEYVRPDHSVVVSSGAHYGYVQRNYVVNNVTYVHRTYVVGGVTYAHIYRPYTYRGMSLNVYVAPRFYAPAFYGWAYRPWAAPVVFSFGWSSRPWYGFYGGYFTPYPSYAGPAYWLTDYMIAMSLQAAYQQQIDAAAASQAQYNAQAYGGQPGLSPDVKQAIADEVRRQLNQEQAEAQSQGAAPAAQGAPQFLADNTTHVFVVANGLNVQSAEGECALTQGDVIQMTAPPAPNSDTANLAVLASKGQDCRKGAAVLVSIADLQEMQNQMRETLDQGLAELQSKQGQGGLPSVPAAAKAPPVQPAYAAVAPPPDPNIASEVSQQAESADQTEADVLSQAESAPTAAPPASVTLGMTVDQVVQLLGQPQMIGDLGTKKIYSYGSMKVVFTAGKVSDIQ